MAIASDKFLQCLQEQKSDVVHMESVARVMNLPIMQRAKAIVVTLYTKIKVNNRVTKCMLSYAESIVKTAVRTASPVAAVFQKPIQIVDRILCSALNCVENIILAITKHPLESSCFKVCETMGNTRRSVPGLHLPKVNPMWIYNSLLGKLQLNPNWANNQLKEETEESLSKTAQEPRPEEESQPKTEATVKKAS